jgi:hypothetical protein
MYSKKFPAKKPFPLSESWTKSIYDGKVGHFISPAPFGPLGHSQDQNKSVGYQRPRRPVKAKKISRGSPAPL